VSIFIPAETTSHPSSKQQRHYTKSAIRIATRTTTISTSDYAAPVRTDEVCWRHRKGERAHSDECTSLLCAELDLDAICWHYLRGECANNEECIHLHPAALDTILIPLLATPLVGRAPPMAGQGECLTLTFEWDTEEVTYRYQGGGTITYPMPCAIS